MHRHYKEEVGLAPLPPSSVLQNTSSEPQPRLIINTIHKYKVDDSWFLGEPQQEQK